MYENKYLQSHYADFFTLFLLVASDNSGSNSQGYPFLSVHTSKLMVFPPFFQSVDKRTEICRGELSSKCCLGGWRQQKLGCSLGPQGDSPPPHTPIPPFTPPFTPPSTPHPLPAATPSDVGPLHVTLIWPEISQELSPTVGAQKWGGQTMARGLDR